MENRKLRITAWILLISAVCLEAAGLVPAVLDWRSAVHPASALVLAAGIYAHLRSNRYEPFKNWRLYVFPLLAYVLSFLAFLPILAAMASLARLRNAGRSAEKVQAGNKPDRLTIKAGSVGLAAGLAAGFYAAGKLGAGLGDSPGLGIGLMLLTLSLGFVGAIAGSCAGIPRDIKAGKPWRVAAVMRAAMLVIAVALSYMFWQGAIGSRAKISDSWARTEIMNTRTAVDAFYGDHERYPKDVGELRQPVEIKGVTIEYSRTPEKPEGFVLRAHHIDGKKVFMVSSNAPRLLSRDKGETDDKFKPAR